MTDSLTERRKAATRTEIARTAAHLFAERGPAAVTAEEIAAGSGVSLRTFYRYFRTKEEAVAPMMAAGGERWLALLTDLPADRPLREALTAAAVDSLTPPDPTIAENMTWTRGLLRAADADAGLRAIWHRIVLDFEHRLVPVLRARLAHGIDGHDELDARLWAAAAATANRVAVEAWAAGPVDATTGPGSPSDLVADAMARLTAGLAPPGA
ncbi:TetR family transcriptional regulator [Isoptericola hypogeus]|uniref:TetR family transcriptional regulator n=1 Tax=Isoptericola hypogeus TaxID=300179 RepID=A0ABP4UVT7_9MICO